jgi:hypothetical protein
VGTFGLPPFGEEERSIRKELTSGLKAAAPRVLEGLGQAAQIPWESRSLKNYLFGPNRWLFGPIAEKIPDLLDTHGLIQELTGIPIADARAALGRQVSEFAGGMLESGPIRPGKDLEKSPWKRRGRAFSEAVGQVTMQIGGSILSGGSTSVAVLPMALQETGASYTRNRQRLIEERNPKTKEELAEIDRISAQAGIDQGVMIWLTEKIGLDFILKGMPTQLRGRASGAVKTQLEKFLPRLSPRVKWALLSMEDKVAAGLMEGSQEGTQEILGAAIDRFEAGDEKAFDNIWERLWEAAGIGFIIGVGASSATGGRGGKTAQCGR